VFRPTAEEFADPFAYIKQISGVASQYGIVQVGGRAGGWAAWMPVAAAR
jgi:hypothetical protein